jgi:hypothetical protein
MKLFWTFIFGLFLGGFTVGMVHDYREWKALKPPVAPSLSAHIEAIDRKVTALATERCMTVNTPVLNVSVYPVENVGTHRVPTVNVKR